MEVVVLAGGFGTRMRPLTYTRPKPLLPLLNRPLLAFILDRLPPDVDRVLLPVNYLREQVEDHFRRHPDPRVRLVEEAQPLGTGGAIKNCADELKGPTFLVYNGDVVSSLDLSALVAAHRARRAQITISLWPVDEPWHYGVVKLAPDHRITSFVEKPPAGTEPSPLINAGHYVLERAVLDAIPAGRFFSIERELYAPWAREGRPLHGFPFEGYWVDCGRPASLLEAHRHVLGAAGLRRVVAPDAVVAADAEVDGYAVGAGCRIGARARVERSVLLPRASVAPHAVVTDSILGDGARVEAGARLEGVVAADGLVVPAGKTLRHERLGLRPEDAEA